MPRHPMIHRLASASLVALLHATIAIGQAPSAIGRDTVRATLVGRAETAEVSLDFNSWVPHLDAAWGTTDGPISPGGGRPAFLQTTLPLHLGRATIPAGRYRLWTVLDQGQPLLIVTRARNPIDSAFVLGDEVARVELTVAPLDKPTNGLYLQIRTTRLGMDTVGIMDSSTAHMTRHVIQVAPANSSRLVLLIGERMMSVGIAAR